jgi:hypothetical protein
VATTIVLFHIVIINERDIVTTTIMHPRILKPETMESRTGVSGRRGYKRLPNRGPNLRSSWVNDGETNRPRVSIHYLYPDFFDCMQQFCAKFNNAYDDYKPGVWSGNNMGWVRLLQGTHL